MTATQAIEVAETKQNRLNKRVEEPAAGAWPYFAEEEIEAAARVLRSGKVNYWTGDEGRQFESEFAKFAGCKYAIALANGSVALECA